MVESNLVQGVHPNDSVELWCCGATVPGAWLESKVKKIRGNRYCVGKVLSTGSLWVDRERLRPIKHCSQFFNDTEDPSDRDEDTQATDNNAATPTRSRSSRFLHRLSLPAISLRVLAEPVVHQARNSCSLM